MLRAAAEEVQIGEVDLRVSASCGVTFYPQAEEVDADVLLRQAGQAMYQAKLAGRNRIHIFDPSEDLECPQPARELGNIFARLWPRGSLSSTTSRR